MNSYYYIQLAERNPALPGSFSFESASPRPSPPWPQSLSLYMHLINLKFNVILIKKKKLLSLTRNFNDVISMTSLQASSCLLTLGAD